MQQDAYRGRANVQAAAGKTLDAQHSGYADPQYFDQNDPFYSHATIAKGAPAPGTMGAGASSSGAQFPAPTPAQIQKLKDNPDKAADFDAKFGPGASKALLGQ